MTNSIAEIEGNEVIFIIGSNTKVAHPVIANKMIKAVRNGAKLIVADPRKTPMHKFATVKIRQRPGTDVALLNAMAYVIVNEGLHDEEFIQKHTAGFDEWKESLKEFTPEYAYHITGVPKDDIIRSARIYGQSRKSAIYYTMGITQHTCGVDNVDAIANLALCTGNIGRPHTGVNPLRGQNNVQGACDTGCLPNVYPGYQRVDSTLVRVKFESRWLSTLSLKPGIPATAISQAILDDKLKALYVMGENPALADPNYNHSAKAFSKLHFMVVQDIFFTETAKFADVILPAGCFAEKNGTFTNTERRIQRITKAVDPPGEAKDDLWIIMQLSNKMGYPMQYETPEDVFLEFASVWSAVAGITYSRIEKKGIQWPCPTRDHPGTQYLHKLGFQNTKAQFIPVSFNLPHESPDKDYPLILMTGRNLFHYHFGSMTRRAKPLQIHADEPYVEINPFDAEKYQISEGSFVRVISRRGEIKAKAIITENVTKGTVFVPLHYAESPANALTDDTALDQSSFTPAYKVNAVRLELA